MKILITFLLIVQATFSQKKIEDSLTFENYTIKYTTYYFEDKIYSINDFYILINQDINLKKCLKNKHKKPYFITIPKEIPKEKHDELFLELIYYITERTKLIESKFHIVADKDYTVLYREMLNKEHRYKGSYMNDITNNSIKPTHTEICKMLQ